MFGNSVVARTGQSWKLILSILLMVIGSFAPLWEGFRINWTLITNHNCKSWSRNKLITTKYFFVYG